MFRAKVFTTFKVQVIEMLGKNIQKLDEGALALEYQSQRIEFVPLNVIVWIHL